MINISEFLIIVSNINLLELSNSFNPYIINSNLNIDIRLHTNKSFEFMPHYFCAEQATVTHLNISFFKQVSSIYVHYITSNYFVSALLQQNTTPLS